MEQQYRDRISFPTRLMQKMHANRRVILGDRTSIAYGRIVVDRVALGKERGSVGQLRTETVESAKKAEIEP
jgi:hypothetical protein